MAIFNWKLFGCTIPEETGEDLSTDSARGPVCPPVPEENSENPDAVEQSYTISDAVLEAYYVTILRKIYTQKRYTQQRDEGEWRKQLHRLNAIDEMLGLWVKRGKALVSFWEQRYREIPREGNEALENAVRRYAEEAYRRMRKGGQKTQNLAELSSEILARAGEQQNVPPEFDLKKLQDFLDHLNALLEQDVKQREIRAKISARLRWLPQYLGSPYAQRYELYGNLRQYSQFNGADKFSTLLYMLLDAESFQGYCANCIQTMADYIANRQSEVCQMNVLACLTDWDNAWDTLKGELEKMPDTQKEYGEPAKRCFALIEVQLRSKTVKYYLAFSGLFDSKDPEIQNKFGFYKKLDEALTKIASAVRTELQIPAVRVTATAAIRYYYSANQSVTLGQACRQVQGNFCKIKRMFSCCERKFLTQLETIPAADVWMYTMYIKWNRCELCQTAMEDFERNGYRYDLLPKESNGQKGDPAAGSKVAHKSLYDGLAQDIAAGKTGIVFHIP